MNFRQKFINTIFVFIFLFFISGFSQIANMYPEGNFKIIVLSDIHITNSESKDARLAALLKDINNQKYPGVEMVFTCGDNVSSVYEFFYPDSIFKGYNRLKKFADIFNILKIPYYFTMGNHEFKIDRNRDSDAPYGKDELSRMEEIWRETTGFDPYYSKNYKGWKFIILNSLGARNIDGRFDTEQLYWLENELKNELPTLVFFHHPIRTDNFKIWGHPGQIANKEDEPGFYRILESNKNHIKGIFVGHGHMWVRDKLFNQIDVFETASFGDDEESPFLLVGIDQKNGMINVAQAPFKDKE